MPGAVVAGSKHWTKRGKGGGVSYILCAAFFTLAACDGGSMVVVEPFASQCDRETEYLGSGLRAQGSGLRASSKGFKGVGCWVWDLGFTV